MGAANNVQLIGRITRDVEVRKPPHDGGLAAASFTLAVDRDVPRHRGEGQQGSAPTADFISCAAFGSRAEALANFTAKGSLLAVHGHIQTRTYKSSEGRTIYVTEVICDSIRFLDTKRVRADQSTADDSSESRNGEDSGRNSTVQSNEQKTNGGYQTYPGNRNVSPMKSGSRQQSLHYSEPGQGGRDPYPAYPTNFADDDIPF